MVELFICALNLSPYIVGINKYSDCRLAGMSLEAEQDLYHALRQGSYYDSMYQQFMQNGYPTLFCSWLPPRPIFRVKYASQGRLRLIVGKESFWLLNMDNEWWQPTQPKRKAISKNRMKQLI